MLYDGKILKRQYLHSKGLRFLNRYVCLLILICLSLTSFVLNFNDDLPLRSNYQYSEWHPLLEKECPVLKNATYQEQGGEYIVNTLNEAARRYQIDSGLLMAMIIAESRCRSNAVSPVGARGLMQLMPKTAEWLGVRDSFVVKENIFGGAQYISVLIRRFKGDLELALAAYNAGPARVNRYSGVPPYAETKRYIKEVMDYYQLLRKPEAISSFAEA